MQNKLLVNLLSYIYWTGIFSVAFGIVYYDEYYSFLTVGLLLIIVKNSVSSDFYEKDYYQLVNKYNMLAEKHNLLVRKHNKLIDSYGKHVDAYDKSMEEIDNIKQGIEDKLKEL